MAGASQNGVVEALGGVNPGTADAKEFEVAATDAVESLGMSATGDHPGFFSVDDLVAGGWAETVGLQVGDVIIAMNGEDMRTIGEEAFDEHLLGRPLLLRIKRQLASGELSEATFPEDGPNIADVSFSVTAESGVESLGIGISGEPPGKVRVDSVIPRGWADRTGIIKPEDAIVALNGEDLTSLGDEAFDDLLARRPLRVSLQRRVAGDVGARVTLAPSGCTAAGRDEVDELGDFRMKAEDDDACSVLGRALWSGPLALLVQTARRVGGCCGAGGPSRATDGECIEVRKVPARAKLFVQGVAEAYDPELPLAARAAKVKERATSLCAVAFEEDPAVPGGSSKLCEAAPAAALEAKASDASPPGGVLAPTPVPSAPADPGPTAGPAGAGGDDRSPATAGAAGQRSPAVSLGETGGSAGQTQQAASARAKGSTESKKRAKSTIAMSSSTQSAAGSLLAGYAVGKAGGAAPAAGSAAAGTGPATDAANPVADDPAPDGGGAAEASGVKGGEPRAASAAPAAPAVPAAPGPPKKRPSGQSKSVIAGGAAMQSSVGSLLAGYAAGQGAPRGADAGDPPEQTAGGGGTARSDADAGGASARSGATNATNATNASSQRARTRKPGDSKSVMGNFSSTSAVSGLLAPAMGARQPKARAAGDAGAANA